MNLFINVKNLYRIFSEGVKSDIKLQKTSHLLTRILFNFFISYNFFIFPLKKLPLHKICHPQIMASKRALSLCSKLASFEDRTV